MYYKYNDYELIYLINEGVEDALKEFIKKYTHLLCKIHKANYINTPIADFVQEGLMVLWAAFKRYNCDYNISFYTYFKICFNRKIVRVFHNDKPKEYNNLKMENVKDNNLYTSRYKIVVRELMLEDSNLGKMLNYCAVRGMSLKTYCKLSNKSYEKEYYKYKKIIKELRKKVD